MKAVDQLITHALGTLPDSLARRKEVLTAISDLITEKHFASPSVKGMLAGLDAMDRAQGLLFEAPNGQSDGNGKAAR